MKSIKVFAAIALFFAVNTISAQAVKWQALTTFNEVLERVNEPAKNNDLSVIKLRSETLMQAAKQLSVKEIPATFNNKKVLDLVAKLQAKTKEVHTLVTAKGSDAALKKSLSEASSIYDEIAGLTTEKK